ncbi:MAG: hypothetical protein HEQ26_02520 [Dolichospermum sp. DL01]|nr:MAG: hypothetical protein HEQ26_02520 [Dolichospermum sp. DL01]
MEDKLSVIAKNSYPNASPVQRSIWKINYRSLPKIVIQMLRPYSCQLSVVNGKRDFDTLAFLPQKNQG